MGKFLKLFAVGLAVLVLAAVVYLWVADFSSFKPWIEDKVTELTGRQFTINGDFSVKVLPSPRLVVSDVSLAGPDWSEEPQMLKVGRLEAEVGLWSLLFQPVSVNSFTLTDVQVLAEINEQGELNWQMGEPSDDEPEEPAEPAELKFPLNIHQANLSNIQVSYRDAGAQPLEFKLDSAVIDEQGDQNTLELTSVLNEMPITLSGTVNRQMATLQTGLGEVTIATDLEYPDDKLEFMTRIQTLARVGELLEVTDLPDEELAIRGNLQWDEPVLRILDLTANLADAELQVTGTLDGDDQSLQLTTDLKGASFASLQPGLPEVSFALDTEFTARGQSLQLKPFTFTFADSQITGFTEIEGGDTPKMTLEASSERLDLSPLMAQSEETAEVPEAAETAEEPPQYVFDENPLPFDLLRTLDVDVKLQIEKVVTPNSEINALALNTVLDGGKLDLTTEFDGQYSGHYQSQIALDAQTDTAQLTLDTNLSDFKLGALSGADVPEDQIPLTALQVSLKSTGGTPRQLASSMDGRVVLTQGAGKVSNELIEKFSGDILAQLFNALNPFAKDEKFTNWECSVFALDFTSGEGEISGFLLQSEKLMVVGGGELDLNDESIDIEFNTKPRKGVGVSADMFVTPFVKLTGTLAQPSVGLNEKGVLLSGGAAILTGGLSFLYTGLMDRATAEGGRCEEAFKSVDVSPPGQQAPEQPPAPESR